MRTGIRPAFAFHGLSDAPALRRIDGMSSAPMVPHAASPAAREDAGVGAGGAGGDATIEAESSAEPAYHDCQSSRGPATVAVPGPGGTRCCIDTTGATEAQCQHSLACADAQPGTEHRTMYGQGDLRAACMAVAVEALRRVRRGLGRPLSLRAGRNAAWTGATHPLSRGGGKTAERQELRRMAMDRRGERFNAAGCLQAQREPSLAQKLVFRLADR